MGTYMYRHRSNKQARIPTTLAVSGWVTGGGYWTHPRDEVLTKREKSTYFVQILRISFPVPSPHRLSLPSSPLFLLHLGCASAPAAATGAYP